MKVKFEFYSLSRVDNSGLSIFFFFESIYMFTVKPSNLNTLTYCFRLPNSSHQLTPTELIHSTVYKFSELQNCMSN